MKILLLCFCLLFSPLFCEEDIRIELATAEKLVPLYLSRWHGFSDGYAEQLRAVLEYDLRYCGFCTVVPVSEPLEKALASSDLNLAFQNGKQSSAHHILKSAIADKKLTLSIFSVKTGTVKQFQNIALTGDLAQDRRQIHKLSDAIVQLLFNQKGVANSKILYSAAPSPQDAKWRSEIWECDWDGKNAKQLTKDESYAITPVVVPAQNSFIYVCYKNGQPKIYRGGLKGRKGERLLDIRGNQLLPAISPKRDKMAFICDASGRADLFVQALGADGSLQGKPAQLFSYPNSTQGSPTFSPDGSKIAFVSDKDGSPRIYVIAASAGSKRSQPQLLTKVNRENTCPCWSPDGTKIAYSAKSSGVRQIWIYDFASKEEKELTSGPGNKENPVWAPDSLHIVFNSTDPSSSELYVVNLNQSETVKISTGPGKKHYPTWGTK
jgi:TolB protein